MSLCLCQFFSQLDTVFLSLLTLGGLIFTEHDRLTQLLLQTEYIVVQLLLDSYPRSHLSAFFNNGADICSHRAFGPTQQVLMMIVTVHGLSAIVFYGFGGS